MPLPVLSLDALEVRMHSRQTEGESMRMIYGDDGGEGKVD